MRTSILLQLLMAVSVLAFEPATGRTFQVKGAKTADVNGQQRVALVIGNSAYASARLANPVNDATDMADALGKCGFAVTKVTDADKKTMRQAVRTFIDGVDRGTVALFYYAGHAVQTRGENYLIPVGADVKLEDEIPDECVSLTSVLGSLENAKAGVNLIILDACRDNPFRGFKRSLERGLKVLEAPKDSESYIAYATAPGSVAADGTERNGTYTACLLKHLLTPNQPVEVLFKQVRKEVKERTGGQQVPWESSSLVGEFCFVGKLEVDMQHTKQPHGSGTLGQVEMRQTDEPTMTVKSPLTLFGASKSVSAAGRDTFAQMQDDASKVVSNGGLVAIGIGLSKMPTLAIDKAKVRARTEMRDVVHTYLDRMLKDFSEEAGDRDENRMLFNAAKRLVDEAISATVPRDIKFDSKNGETTAYVSIEQNPAVLEGLLESAGVDNKAAYARFRASKVSKGLADAVKKYNESKR